MSLPQDKELDAKTVAWIQAGADPCYICNNLNTDAQVDAISDVLEGLDQTLRDLATKRDRLLEISEGARLIAEEGAKTAPEPVTKKAPARKRMPSKKGPAPWENATDGNKSFPLHIPAKTKEQLDYLRAITGVPTQRLLRELLIDQIEAKAVEVWERPPEA
jgi:hypothetical protein